MFQCRGQDFFLDCQINVAPAAYTRGHTLSDNIYALRNTWKQGGINGAPAHSTWADNGSTFIWSYLWYKVLSKKHEKRGVCHG